MGARIYVPLIPTSEPSFRNQHDGTFAEEALTRSSLDERRRMEQAGWRRVAIWLADGRPDIVKTHFAADTTRVYQ